MCLYILDRRYKQNRPEKTVVGYKIVRDRGDSTGVQYYGTIYQSTTLPKDVEVSSENKPLHTHKNQLYPSGFHIYKSLLDAHRNYPSVDIIGDLTIVEVRGRHLLAVGREFGCYDICYVTKYCKVLREIK